MHLSFPIMCQSHQKKEHGLTLGGEYSYHHTYSFGLSGPDQGVVC